MPITQGPGGNLIVVQSKILAGSPGTSVLNGVVTWGSTTGASVLSTPVTIDSSGNITSPGTLTVNGSGPHLIGGSTTIGTNSSQSVLKVLGANTADKAPVLSVFRNAIREVIITVSTGGGLIINNTSGVGTYTDTNLAAGNPLLIDSSNNLRVQATTASTSATTGALQVAGGAGIAGSIYAGGSLTVNSGGSGNSNVFFESTGTNVNRFAAFTKSGLLRWNIGTTGNETGANGGSNFILIAYDDTGATIGNALQFNRSTMQATFGGAVTASSTLAVTGATSLSDNVTLRKDIAATPVSFTIDNRNTTGAETIWLTEDGVSSNYAYIGRNNSSNASNPRRVTFGMAGGGSWYFDSNAAVTIANGTSTTSTTTGALVVTGGVGVGGSVNVAGAVTVSNSTGAFSNLNTPAGQWRWLAFNTSGTTRWLVAADQSAESGANAGSNFAIRRYDDSGAYLADGLNISRATGAVTMSGVLTVNGTSTSPFAGPIRPPTSTVSGLPSASTSTAGAIAVATDLTSITSGSTATGGGSLKHLVMSDGTNWLVV